MNEMFEQLKSYEVEAPLEVMELAIAKANRKRKLRMLARWSAAFLLLLGAAVGWNWKSQNEESTAPLKVTEESVTGASTKQNTPSESTSVSVPVVVVKPSQRSKSRINSVASRADKIEVPMVKESNRSSVENSSAKIESMQMMDSSSVTPEVLPKPSEDEQVKKSKPNGQRKLKLIIPQP